MATAPTPTFLPRYATGNVANYLGVLCGTIERVFAQIAAAGYARLVGATFTGPVVIADPSTSNVPNFTVSGASDTNGVAIKLIGNGGATPNKFIRVFSGAFQVINSAYTTALMSLDDSGNAQFNGAVSAPDFNLASTGGMAGAWTTSFTPVVTASTGTLTTASATCRYKKFGRSVWINLAITDTTNGTGAGAINVTLPFAAAVISFLPGRETAITGKALQGIVGAAGVSLSVLNYDNSYPGANGTLLVLSGAYEATT